MKKVDTCSAVIFNGDGTWERRDDFQIPEPPEGGAVLAVEAVGLCHSDVAQLNGQKHVPGEISPTVPGHEIVGRVHALDSNAELGVEIGDRVAVNIVVPTEPTDSNPFGFSCYGYSFSLEDSEGLWGGYGEYMSILPQTQLEPLTNELSAEELTIFEPLSNVIAWTSRVNWHEKMKVVVQGPGHMGLTFAAMAKEMGTEKLIVTGTSEDQHRLSIAEKIGADFVIDVSNEDPVEKISEATGGVMADLVVDLSSAPQVPGLCLDLVRYGGDVIWAGLKDRQAVPVVTDTAVMRGITIHGGAGGTNRSLRKAVEILNTKDFPTSLLLGEVFSMNEIDDAMAVLNRTSHNDAVRAVLSHNRK
ncbi:MAG: zinc-binding dehydrogenase [Actinomycetota bacterium]|nr:alcohol dehydrogenase [Acidimicrobiaceae bacterium]MEC7899959.1 zinc-binding dehydrogenase [Actinomycetota bacterium]|tara:strand:+ start:8531 stop:9607 length:1077 start_codon:yes stop_codon:yes gene_type:complete